MILAPATYKNKLALQDQAVLYYDTNLRYHLKNIEIQEITNFTFQNRVLQIQPHKCINYPKMFSTKMAKVCQTRSENTFILWTFLCIVWDIWWPCTGDQEIWSVSGRLPDNQEELANICSMSCTLTWPDTVASVQVKVWNNYYNHKLVIKKQNLNDEAWF